MHHRKIKGLVAVMIASACFMQCSCGKSVGTKTPQEEPSDAGILFSAEKETDGTSIVSETTNRVVDLNFSDLQKDMATAPSESRSETPSSGNGADQDASDAASPSVGALATANEKHSYFVVHHAKIVASIEEENNRTHEGKLIYSTTPKKDVESRIDSLLLVGDYLFFRESGHLIKRIDLSSYTVEDVLEGNIERLTHYNGYLYFEEEGTIRRASLDGKSEDVLFTATKAAKKISVPFCILGDKIYFTDPTDLCDNGFYYGTLLCMDTDGSNRKEMDTGISVSNYVPMLSDGEKIYLRGMTESDDGSVYSGFLSCLPDGSDQFFYDGGADDILYCFDGKLYRNRNNMLLAIDGNNESYIMWGEGFEFPSTITDFAAVGDWYYVMGESSQFRTGAVTIRINHATDYYLYLDPC